MFDPSAHGIVASLWVTSQGAGGILSPMLTNFLLEHNSWHAAFILPGATVTALGMIAMLLPDESVEKTTMPMDAADNDLKGLSSRLPKQA